MSFASTWLPPSPGTFNVTIISTLMSKIIHYEITSYNEGYLPNITGDICLFFKCHDFTHRKQYKEIIVQIKYKRILYQTLLTCNKYIEIVHFNLII